MADPATPLSAPQSGPLSASLLADLHAALGPGQLRTGEAVAQLDPGWHPGNLGAGVVAFPRDVAQVQAVLRLCARHQVPVVPQAGRTGLVGGSVSQPGELVLSLLQFNQIEEVDPVSRLVVVQAGATLQAVQEAAAAHGLEPGIDLAARGSATVGGMVSTNAGGVMAFRNGVMRHRVLGLEAVLPDGTLYRDLTRVVKHSAGYDLKHLFIGAEGTLGIVTRVVLKLDPLPAANATALFTLPSVEAALDAVRLALAVPSGHLRAAEALWRDYLLLTADALGWREPGVDLDQPIHLLLGLGGADEAGLQDAFLQVFEQLQARHPAAGALVASSQRQAQTLWRLRENTEAIYRRYPDAPSYDVSVPAASIPAYVQAVMAGLPAIDPALRPYVFGHLADGNLHLVFNHAGPFAPAQAAAVEALLYQDLRALGGSFSAEHGVGSKRIGAMQQTAGLGKTALMARLKALLDPAGGLNPGKVLPPHGSA